MPAHAPQRFHWTWELRASPEALWPLVSNTDRFNRDCGYPPVELVSPPPDASAPVSNARRLRARAAGLVIEWEELAFEWIEPFRYSVERTYFAGPVARMAMSCELQPRAGGGTTLGYAMEFTPANLLGRLALPYSIGRRARALTERVFRRYDEAALRRARVSPIAQPPQLADGAASRLATIGRALAAEDAAFAAPAAHLADFIASADDLSAGRMRPYALAAEWHADRRATLELFLHATRAGLLDFSWELVCPHCRGAKAVQSSLAKIKPDARCETCHIDFTANFDQSVELTFTPNPAIRPVTRVDYCVGGPQVTPHIVAQQRVPAASERTLRLALSPGRYRVRSPQTAAQSAFRVSADADAPPAARIDLAASASPEPVIACHGELLLANPTAAPRLAILEHLAWSDDATTAAEVTSLQVFRDLFSHEVLRRGEKIHVGAITVAFTDLKNSTQLYRDIGDAPAFGRVLTHFDILRTAIAAEGGSIVKTMGDAVMAVFTRPVSAVRAMTHAQRWLAHPEDFPPLEDAVPFGAVAPPQPLALKAAVNCGPCLVINQNDRLDYFGSTVNFAARLCGLASGDDLIVSSAVHADAEVAAHLANSAPSLAAVSERATLKGFGADSFEVWRVK